MPKSIFISGSFGSFTSGTPNRGMIETLLHIKPDWNFTIEFAVNEDNTITEELRKKWSEFPNVNILLTKNSRFLETIKKLLGIKQYKKWIDGYDFYLNPCVPDSFYTISKPSVSLVADLSSINLPKHSSMKWHGNRIFKNTLDQAVKHNSKLIAISDFTRYELSVLYPEHYEKFVTVHNGIAPFWFDNTYETNELTKSIESLKYWIWWGYISNRKNIKPLFEAYLQAKQQEKDLPEIVFIGKVAPDQLDCMNTIKNNPSCFKIFNFQEPYILKTMVKNSKGLVFPSLYEGFGLPVIEAYSQGLPVMHSNVTSLPEVAGGLGIGVNPYKTDSIINGLIQLKNVDNNIEMKTLRKKWASQFTYENAANKLVNLIVKAEDY